MKTQTLFYHGVSSDGRRFTIAGKFFKDATDNDDLILGIAICSSIDQFSKKIGRKKAEGRVMSKSTHGCMITSLYSDTYFESYLTHKGGFLENWFIGKEVEVFLSVCTQFEQYTFKELKSTFRIL